MPALLARFSLLSPPAKRFRFLSLTLGLAGCLLLGPSVLAGPEGDLDVGFGSHGITEVAINQITAASDYATATAVQLDGKLLVLGTVEDAAGDWDCAVSRLLPNGSLDPHFGSGGTSIFSFTSADGFDECRAISVHPSTGKIVVAGHDGWPGHKEAGVARLLSDGSLDAGFGTGGMQTVSLGTDIEINAVASHVDGRVFMAGSIEFAALDTDFLMLEMSATGTFSHFATHAFDAGNEDKRDVAKSILLQGDEMVLSGDVKTDSGNIMGVVRLLANRTVDGAFGTAGEIRFSLGSASSSFTDLLMQSDGRLVLVGTLESATYEVGAARFSRDGRQDLAYGTSGVALAPMGNSGDGRAKGAHLDGSDWLVVSGNSDGDRAMAAVRFNYFGSWDPTFGNQPWGFEVLPAPLGYAPAEAMEIGPDGEIYLVGWWLTNPWDDVDFVVLKLKGSVGIPFDLVY